MLENKTLYQKINAQKEGLKKFNPEVFAIPEYITQNLKHSLFDWQREALENLLYYEHLKSELKTYPTHLMFNMATGTGKTLLMAATILYYYQQGYRHFIFFVNQSNIVDKTGKNFIDSTHTKYLFTEKIIIDDKTIPIKKVDTLSDHSLGIEIKFTTIQKLYNDIHVEKENQTTLDDLNRKNIVMLADEAHHLNANTKSILIQGELHKEELRGSRDEKEKKGWEHTVIELILNKKGKSKKNKNVLLEFTATVPANEQVAEKYQDKIIYKFGLKEFLQAGYTKEINLISSTLNKKERILQALVFQWYRHKIALDNCIANFKPVILFRSKTIDDSKNDYEEFLREVEHIKSEDFNFLETISNKIDEAEKSTLVEMGKSRIEKILTFMEDEKITAGEIADWIRGNFGERSTIITNSKTNKNQTEKTDEEIEKLLNSLEDKNNHIRAIFTVDRLTEGWDVLNLFDIVRLYEGQNAGGNNGKTPEATTKEKQLIGRGVRYFPFSYHDKLPNKRKFDDDLNNELRVLEDLYYHTYDEESRYITHLKEELKKDGYIKDDRVVKAFALKDDFKKTSFYKQVFVWQNKQLDNPARKKQTLKDMKKDFKFEYKVKSLAMSQDTDILDTTESNQNIIREEKGKTISLMFEDIEKHIFRKAVSIKAKQENSLFRFEKLKKELAISSIDDLQHKNFLGDVKLSIVVNKGQGYDSHKRKNIVVSDKEVYDSLMGEEKLAITMKFLGLFLNEFRQTINPKIGSEKFYPKYFEQVFGESKIKIIDEKNLDDNVVENEWYILDGFVGTSEEKGLIDFVKNSIGNLQEKYDEVYLLRNEEVYKIYDFEKGRGFQPDFLLFLKGKDRLYYQVFIEAKGDQSKDSLGIFKSSQEAWKENFLEEITKKYGSDKVIRAENPNYRLIGLPFFNESSSPSFQEAFRKSVL